MQNGFKHINFDLKCIYNEAIYHHSLVSEFENSNTQPPMGINHVVFARRYKVYGNVGFGCNRSYCNCRRSQLQNFYLRPLRMVFFTIHNELNINIIENNTGSRHCNTFVHRYTCISMQTDTNTSQMIYLTLSLVCVCVCIFCCWDKCRAKRPTSPWNGKYVCFFSLYFNPDRKYSSKLHWKNLN